MTCSNHRKRNWAISIGMALFLSFVVIPFVTYLVMG